MNTSCDTCLLLGHSCPIHEAKSTTPSAAAAAPAPQTEETTALEAKFESQPPTPQSESEQPGTAIEVPPSEPTVSDSAPQDPTTQAEDKELTAVEKKAYKQFVKAPKDKNYDPESADHKRWLRAELEKSYPRPWDNAEVWKAAWTIAAFNLPLNTAPQAPSINLKSAADGRYDNAKQEQRRTANEKKVEEAGVAAPEDLEIPDMPSAVLCGRLGEWCHKNMSRFCLAYSWPAFVTVASVLVKGRSEKDRSNLFSALVGPPDSGKSCAYDDSIHLFGLEASPDADLAQEYLIKEKAGSAEGLAERIGDRNGQSLLWFPDELGHVLEKASIENASFSYILNNLFYKDNCPLIVSKRKQIAVNARLSLGGGIVQEKFDELFSDVTIGGLYDRFLFGLCPTGWRYDYRPCDGPSLFETMYEKGRPPAIMLPPIHPEVWEARTALQKEEKIDSRAAEGALRVARMCAGWDERPELRVSDLGPAWALARYQQSVRSLLQPNPGKNYEAMVAHKIRNYLQRKGGGKFVELRYVKLVTHINKYGPVVINRVLQAMKFGREIELLENTPKNGGPTKILIRLDDEESSV